MAYHDPRYGPSPYSFQPQFHPPQPALHQYNYGVPQPQPVAPAPPQSYIPPQNAAFHPHMPQQMPGNIPQRMQPEYPGPHNYDTSFQQNSQYGSSYNYHGMPFQGQVNSAPGGMPGNPRPLLIPPPPLGIANSPQSAGGPSPSAWTQNSGLPPKPPSVVQLQPNIAHNPGQHNYQNSSGKSQELQGGNSGNAAGRTRNLTDVHQGVVALGKANVNMTSQQRVTSLSAQQSPYRVNVSGVTPADVMDNSNSMSKNRQQSQTAAFKSQRVERPKTPQAAVSPSPDMYSPQSQTGGLPGLEGGNYGPDGGQEMVSERNTKQLEMSQHELQHEAIGDTSSKEGMVPDEKGSQVNQVESTAPVNPFDLKQNALSALKDLNVHQVDFRDIIAEGIDHSVLRTLYTELGLNPSKSQDDMSKAQTASTSQTLVAGSHSPAILDQTKAQEKKSTTPLQLPKPLPRADYIAKLKAAKSGKSADSADKPEGMQQDTAVVLDVSDSGTESSELANRQKETDLPKKSEANKAMSTTDIVRQRLEALKKTMGERQRLAREEAQAKVEKDPKASGEYTPANPFFSPEAASTEIPGLSMFDEHNPSRAEGSQSHINLLQSSAMQGGTQIFGRNEKEHGLEEDLADLSDTRKRLREASLSESPGQEQVKRRLSPNEDRQVVIELSDDEEQGAFQEGNEEEEEEEEEGELQDQSQTYIMQQSVASDLVLQDDATRKQLPQSQAQLDDLAAREEEIRLFRQKIAALEAKKKAKKVVASTLSTPTPSTTPNQAHDVSGVPALQAVATQKSVLASVGDQVQAQQQSLVAQKSVIEKRLEKEEQAYQEVVGNTEASVASGMIAKNDRTRRQERIATLRKSLWELDSQISQAESDLTNLRRHEQELQERLQRGIEGRESKTKELNDLINALAAEEAAEEQSLSTGLGRVEAAAQLSPSASAEEANLPNDSPSDKQSEDGKETQAESESSPSMAGDDTMDISDGEEGEISDSEASSLAQDAGPQSSNASSPDRSDRGVRLREEDHAPAVSTANREREDSSMDVEEIYEPQSDKESSIGEEMDYEPDYEPEPEPELEESDSDSSVAAEDESQPAEYQGSQGTPESSTSQISEDGEVPDDDNVPESHAVGDANPQQNEPYEEDEEEEDEEEEEEEDSMDEESSDGQPEPEQHAKARENAVESEMSASHDLPGLGSGDEDDAIDDEDDYEDLVNQAQVSTGFTPYESPLQMFKAYRYHPQYVNNVSGGFNSITFSHRIDPQRQLCRYELQHGACKEIECPCQHFEELNALLCDYDDNVSRKVKQSNFEHVDQATSRRGSSTEADGKADAKAGDKLILELGSPVEGRTPEQKKSYLDGLRALMKDLRGRGLSRDASAVATEIISYRRRFLGDSSRVLTNIQSNT